MSIIPNSELLKRALAYILEALSADPTKNRTKLLDEAAMRFNLSPKDSMFLAELLKNETTS